MNWANDIGYLIPALLLGAFILFYVLFLWRNILVGIRLGQSVERLIIKFILRSGIFFLLLIALMGPTFGDSVREVKSVGKDIFVCLDLSQSMNARDIQPSRLEKVKFELKNLVEAFPADRVGLIMFSNEAFVQCPLTYDNNALSLFIQTLNTGLVPNSGTDFAPPIRMALEKLTDEEVPQNQRKAQVILLISDGEDFGDETDAVADEIEEASIKLFTLGVGTESGAKIPTRNGFKLDRNKNEVVTKLNSTSLRQLASKTDGDYFEINEQQNDIERLINAINRIEGELKDSREIKAEDNKYFYFLLAAVGLLILDALFQLKVFRV